MLAGFLREDGESQYDRNAVARRRAFRRAVEIAILVCALSLLGLLRSAPRRPPFWAAGHDDGCVHLGRAGASCPQPREAERACVSLGRAGRLCPGSED
jgi:hypothetical protein